MFQSGWQAVSTPFRRPFVAQGCTLNAGEVCQPISCRQLHPLPAQRLPNTIGWKLPLPFSRCMDYSLKRMPKSHFPIADEALEGTTPSVPWASPTKEATARFPPIPIAEMIFWQKL